MRQDLTQEYENVIPAQAGIQNAGVWIPTFVGMTSS